MRENRTVASAVLSLLFIGVLFIYLLDPNDGRVLALGITILAVSTLIAFTGGWREIAALGAVALFVSIIAAGLLSYDLLGAQLTFCLPVLLIGSLFGVLALLWRNALKIPSDQVVVIKRYNDGHLYTRSSGIALPPVAFLEKVVAQMPRYELRSTVSVASLNTQSTFNVDKVDLQLLYHLKDPVKLLQVYPNREAVMREKARELGKEVDQASLEPNFWEKVFEHQVREDVDDQVRQVIFEEKGLKGPVDVYQRREDLRQALEPRIRQACERWGMEIMSVEVEKVEVDPSRFQSMFRENALARENQEAELKASREAERIRRVGRAEAERDAEAASLMLDGLISTLKQQFGEQINTDQIQQIVVKAIAEADERRQRAETSARLGETPVTEQRKS